MDEFEDIEPVELEPRHRRRITVLAALTNVGLLLICASAVWTVQPPTFGLRRWAGYAVLALLLLLSAALPRGRSAFSNAGKLAVTLAALIVLSLAYDPQLASVGALGDTMPPWLSAISPGLGTLGVLLAVVCGFSYLFTINGYLRHRHHTLFAWGLKSALILIIGLGLATYLCLHRLYELDPTVLSLLIGNALQYTLVGYVVVNLSGRLGVGSSMQIYLSLTVLLALARNILAAHGQ
ncbi:MAG: hypothetical protein WCP21_12625 [Armatimonadota bacterium]